MIDKAEESPGCNPEPVKNRPDLRRFLLPEGGPRIAPTAFIAEGAVVLGGVSVGEHASVWYGCVLRGDINHIAIGPRSNLQDGVIIHVSDEFPAIVGSDVSIGHRALIHACEIGDETLVGMGAIIMDGAVVEPDVIIGGGSVVSPGKVLPSGGLYVGSPAKRVRDLRKEELDFLRYSAAHYVKLKDMHISSSKTLG